MHCISVRHYRTETCNFLLIDSYDWMSANWIPQNLVSRGNLILLPWDCALLTAWEEGAASDSKSDITRRTLRNSIMKNIVGFFKKCGPRSVERIFQPWGGPVNFSFPAIASHIDACSGMVYYDSSFTHVHVTCVCAHCWPRGRGGVTASHDNLMNM